MSFDKFVQAVADIPDELANGHFRSQHTFVTDEKERLRVDHVCRMELIESELGGIFRRLGIQNQKIPHILKTDRLPYAHYYTQNTKTVIAERFATDVQMFDYKF
jgi:hypothetical protein